MSGARDHKKDGLDKQIARIQVSMQVESDPDKLAALEEQLNTLTGKAQATIGELEKKDKGEAQKVEQSGDELLKNLAPRRPMANAEPTNSAGCRRASRCASLTSSPTSFSFRLRESRST